MSYDVYGYDLGFFPLQHAPLAAPLLSRKIEGVGRQKEEETIRGAAANISQHHLSSFERWAAPVYACSLRQILCETSGGFFLSAIVFVPTRLLRRYKFMLRPGEKDARGNGEYHEKKDPRRRNGTRWVICRINNNRDPTPLEYTT